MGNAHVRGVWPFVARDADLALIEQDERGAVLIGDAGIGKSRLLAESVERVSPAARRVVRVAATESLASVPFGALAGALSRELAPGPSVEALSRVLSALADDGPLSEVVLAVDDAHLLDDASAGLLLVAARAGARVIATVRSRTPCPEAVTRLWKDDFARRHDVRPLDEHGVGDLLTEALGGPLDELSRHRLFTVTGGNLLFLRELLRHAQETGTLIASAGVWTWIEPEHVAPGVLDLVTERLRSVLPSLREVVDVLALCEPVGRVVLDAACGREACEEAEQSGIITVVASGRREEFRLVHPLYAHALREEIGATRRRELAGRVAVALAECGVRRRDDRLRAALMSLEAGAASDPGELHAAARDAGSRGDLALAERFAREAVRIDNSFDSQVELGSVLHWEGRHEDLVKVLGHDPPEDAPPDLVVRAALILSASLYWTHGDIEAADALLERAIQRVGSENASGLLGQRSELLLFAGRAQESIEVGRGVLDDPRASVHARLQAYSGVLVSRAQCGQLTSVESDLPVAMALVGQAGPDLAIYSAGGAIVAGFIVQLFSGRLAETDALASALHDDALQRPADPYLGMWSFLLGRSALAQGRLVEATAHLRDAASLLRHRDPGEVLPWALAALAQSLGAADDGANAKAVIDELLAVRKPSMHHLDVEIELGRAWAASAQGQRSHARHLAGDVGRSLLVDGRFAMAALALHDALRLGASPASVLDGLERAAGTCDGAIFGVFVDHTRARMANDIDGLLAAADGFERTGWMLHAAECAAGASSIAAEEGLRVRQREALIRSAALAASCGPALTPMLETVTAKRSLRLLTRREQEIALLAARGMSKREIADMLSLSARTVGNHINHLYGKLAIGSRAELGIALGFAPSGD